MSQQSRRSFLVAAGAGSVAVGAGAVLVAASPSQAGTPADETADDLPVADARVVAYVSDPGNDEVTLMVDDRESVVRDRVLARALARAAREQAR